MPIKWNNCSIVWSHSLDVMECFHRWNNLHLQNITFLPHLLLLTDNFYSPCVIASPQFPDYADFYSFQPVGDSRFVRERREWGK